MARAKRNSQLALTIRSGDASDVEALQQLARRTIRASYTSFLGADAVMAFIESGASDGYVQDNIREASVLLSDDIVMGFAVCKQDLIELMMIHSDVHRRGLGTALLRHCEGRVFRSHGDARLESFRDNDVANRFYEKNGWTQTREYMDASGVAMIEFRKHRP